ncbi:MAG: zinc-ribbon domain-containing protein, partial [Myxococcales bacterium]
MKISCPSCEAKYSIGDDKVQNRLAKIRCRKCGVDIVIDGRVQPPTVSVGDTAAAPQAMQAAAIASHSYTIDFGENDQRTMTLE